MEIIMHIAVCDDNIADRKQMERLLQRSSDKHTHTTGAFYIDSYGNVEAVFRSPMLYDVFFIDMTAGNVNGYDLACRLIHAGVTAPIVLCCSSIDYRVLAASGESLSDSQTTPLRYLNKPIRVEELEQTLEDAILLKKNVIPTIELRGDQSTLYVHEDEILYLQKSGNRVHVTLTQSRSIDVLSTIETLYSQLLPFTNFYVISDKTIINVRFIRKLSLLKAAMQDQRTFSISPLTHHTLKNALECAGFTL